MKIDDLIGKRIESIWLIADRTAFALGFADGTFAGFFAEGDCCSTVWIEGFELYGFKGMLTSVVGSEERSRNAFGGYFDNDCFVTFTTERGRLIIDLRTDHGSGGAYGGYLVRGECTPGPHWRQIRETIAE